MTSLNGKRPPRALVFVWDNYGPSLVDRVDAVALELGTADVVCIELRNKSSDYSWDSVTPKHATKVNLQRERSHWLFRAAELIIITLRCRPKALFTCHYERPEIFVLAAWARLCGIPVFVMSDSKFDDYQRHLWRENLKRLLLLPYSGAIAGSRRTEEYLKFFGMQAQSVFPGYDAISIARIRALARVAPSPKGAPFHERHFTIVARLIPKKNLGMAIEAFARLRGMGSKRRLVICGDGPLWPVLRQQVESLNIADAVEFVGFVQTERLAQILGSTLALIQPSIEEQFGIAIAEAVAMGVPIIASDQCGARDSLLRTGVNGFIFEPDNVRGLESHLIRLDNDEELWRHLSIGCEEFAGLADVGVFVNSVSKLSLVAPQSITDILAPIAIFAYRRARHLEQCLDSLEQCPEFSRSKVFVFIDGPRSGDDVDDVNQVIDLVNSRLRPNMTVITRKTNRGLAASIITEVTDLVKRYDRVIVIEDDLIVEPATLAWLNNGLEAYKDDRKVMQIGANQFHVPEFGSRKMGTFQRYTTTWGWATWKRAWDQFDPGAKGWKAVSRLGSERDAFDAGGVYPYSDMLTAQMLGEIDSWGIRWSWSMHKAGGVTLLPPRSLVHNKGLSASATHNSIGWLKQFVVGPPPLKWRDLAPPTLPAETLIVSSEEQAFRRGLLRTNAMRNAKVKSLLAIIGIRLARLRTEKRIDGFIVIAQLPPPVSGLSLVSDKFAEQLSDRDLLHEAISISPTVGKRGLSKIAAKAGAVVRAAIKIMNPTYRRFSSIYMTCDGGFGQVYNIILAIAARISGYQLWIHHHSYAYIDSPKKLMNILLRVCRPDTRHIFLCDEMSSKFASKYESNRFYDKKNSVIISNAFSIESDPSPQREAQTLTIGHLSNLTVEKGSVRFIELFRSLVAAGVRVRAEIAGPVGDEATALAIKHAEAEFPTLFSWSGPLYHTSKRDFFRRIDIFVFPTNYTNEAQPLVLLEALAHGCAIIASSRGCISCDHHASPGLILDVNNFEQAAYEWISQLQECELQQLRSDARRAFDAAQMKSIEQIHEALKGLAGRETVS